MNTENEGSDQPEHKSPIEPERKIHKTHFPVLNIPLQDNDHDSGYEWVNSGNGHWKLVSTKNKK